MAKFGKIEKIEVEYIDIRPIYIPALTYYPNGITPRKGEKVSLTENESIKFLKQKNGRNPCWKKVQGKRVEPKETKIESEVTENGSR